MKYLKKFESWGSGESQGTQGQEEQDDYDDEPSTTDEVVQKFSRSYGDNGYELMDNDFFIEFLEAYPSKDDFEERLSTYKGMMNEEEAEVYMLETEFKNSFPGEEEWYEFCSELVKVGW